MSDLLPFDGPAPEPRGRSRGHLRTAIVRLRRGDALGGLWAAAPLVVLTVLLGQITVKGILPALREKKRLEGAEFAVSSWEER
ncbi:MAG TPA: hypothetical protein ENJ09_09825, partial [Planctomycetes bacterium]|nr:hypothetical protein [Planctomycetota bacterium]